jgi:Zn-dependent peptidase ImmA (M78 family)
MANPVTEGYRAARELRQRLKLGRHLRVDPFAIAEQVGVSVVRRPLAERRIAGAYLYRPLEERSFILINATDVLTRQRFTAAHELGHWRFDRESTVIDDDLEGASTSEERRANAFAAELLLPEVAVRQWSPGKPWSESPDDVAALAVAYGISFEAALWRLHNCLQIEIDDLRQQQGEISAEYRAQLAARGDETTVYPPDFVRLTNEALEGNLISRKRFEELRGAPASEVKF